MSDEIVIDGSPYIPLDRAAKEAALSADYILRLCKSGRISHAQIGTKRYVSENSLKEFIVTHNYELALRKQKLAEERAAEYSQASIRTAAAALITPVEASNSQIADHAKSMRKAVYVLTHKMPQLKPRQAEGESTDTFPPLTDLLHKSLALALSLSLVFGAYAAVDPSVIKFAAESMRDTKVAIIGAIRNADAISLRAQTQLAAAAEDPEGTFASLWQIVPNLARAVNTKIDSLVYGTAFQNLANDSGSSVAVEIKPFAQAAAQPAATTPVSAPSTVATTKPNQTFNTYPVVERVVQTERIVRAGGITEEYLAGKLQELDNKFSSQFFALSTMSSPPASGGFANVVAMTQRIDNLSDVTIQDATISGSTITNTNLSNVTVSGSFSLSGTVIGITSGGTGTSTVPSYGQLLLGNAAGGYDLVATSSLGITGGGGGTWGSITGTLADQTDLQAALDARLTLTDWYATSTSLARLASDNTWTGGNVFGNASTTNLYLGGKVTGAGLSTCSGSSDKLLYNATTGFFECGGDAGAGGGITSLKAQYSNVQTGSTQTFATSSDTNIGLTIASAGDIHTFTSTWAGTLAVARGGTGASTFSYGLVFSPGGTSALTNVATSSLGLITTDVAEGSNQYFTNTRADARVAAASTTIRGMFSGTSPITFNSGTGAIGINTASGSQDGALSAADFTSFYGRVSTTSIDTLAEMETLWGSINVLTETEIDASAELAALLDDETGTGNVVFSASPIFSGTATFANLSATEATSTSLYTTTLGLNSEYFTDFTGSGILNTSGALTLDRTGAWTGTFDGQEGSYYLANSFSTTSASYFLAQNTSAAFSTTSSSYFLSQNQGNAFSTTSANTFFASKSTTDLTEGSNLYFTSTRADARVAAASTTIRGMFSASSPLLFNSGTGDFSIQAASAAQAGYLAAADWTLFNNKVATTSIDTLAELETLWGSINVLTETEIDASSELAALLDDETGTGNVVFSASPTFTGTAAFADTSITNATSTNFFSTTASSTNLFSTGASLGTATVGSATSSVLYINNQIGGAGLAACNLSSSKLLYNATTRQFECGADAGAGGGITAIGPLGQYQTGSTQTLATSTTGTDFTISASGDTITFNLPFASLTNTGKLSAADFTSFYNRVSTTSIDTLAELETLWGSINVLTETEIDASSELAALMDDETGSGALVFAGSPTFTGTANFASLIAAASSTIGGGTSTTGLTIFGGATTTGNAYFASNVGIGTSSPYANLSIQQSDAYNNLPVLAIADSSGALSFELRVGTSSDNKMFMGINAGLNATDAHNSNFFGYSAGFGATDAFYSNFFGASAGNAASAASYSNFFGYNTGSGATNAAFSNFLGTGAGTDAVNAANSIFIGSNAGANDTVDNTVSGTSIAIGQYSGTGGFSDSIALGHGVINSATQQLNLGNVLYATGIYNSDTQSSAATATGKFGVGTTTPGSILSVGNTGGINFTLATSTFSTTGGINLAGGCYAVSGTCISGGSGVFTLDVNGNLFASDAFNLTSTGQGNIALGTSALLSNDTGIRNIAHGVTALYSNLSGSYNIASGESALMQNVSGSYNIGIGYDAGNTLTAGDNNIAIGQVYFAGTTGSNQLNIQNIIFGTGNGGTGNTLSTGNIGIGTTTPWAKLSVQATVGQTNPVFEIASSSSATAFLSVAGSGFGTTTLSGLNISGSATSTSNVGFNITTGCFAVNGTCLSSSGGGLASTDIDTSAELAAILTDETGSGALVFAGSPTFTGTAIFANLTAAQATSTAFYTTTLGLNSEYFTDFTGSGILNTSGALTLDRTGAWTGTFDGQEGSYYLDRTNHSGTQLAATISDFSTAADARVAAGTTTIRGMFSASSPLSFNSGTGDFSIQVASAAQAGYLAAADWTLFNNKVSTTSIDTLAELETLWGSINVLTETEIDASSELAALLDDETGSGALVFAGSPTFTGTAMFAQASTTRLSVFNNAYFGGTATTTFSSDGSILVSGVMSLSNSSGEAYVNAGASNLNLQSQATAYISAPNGIQFSTDFGSTFGFTMLGSTGFTGIGSSSPWAKLSVGATAGQTSPVFQVASSSAGTAFLTVASTGFGTTTVSGLDISGSATSTSNVGFNITTGCFAVNGACLTSGGSSGLATTSIDTSAELAAILTDETGSGALVFAGSPTFTGTAAFADITASGTLGVTGLSTLTGGFVSQASSTVAGNFTATGAAAFGSTLGVTGATTLSSALTYGGVTLNNAVTGTGNMVLSASPTLVSPTIGAALGTSLALTPGALSSEGITVSYSDPGPDNFRAKIFPNKVQVRNSGGGGDTFSSGTELGQSSLIFRNSSTGETSGDGFVHSLSGLNASIINREAGALTFSTSNTARLTISSAGSVGVGTTTPGSLLSVQGVANFDTATSTFYSTGGINLAAGCFAISGTCLSAGLSSSDIDTSAELAAILTDETGSGALVFAGSPTFTGTITADAANFSGNVGVGTTSPAEKLDVGGNINIGGGFGLKINSYTVLAASSTTGNIFAGTQAGLNFSISTTSVTGNTAFGHQALYTATSSIRNTSIGYQSLYSLADYSANENTALGYQAGYSTTFGLRNNFLGNSSGFNNTTGSRNAGLGSHSIFSNTTGTDNLGIGTFALYGQQTGTMNVALGTEAGNGGFAAYSASGGTYLGAQTGRNIGSGADFNTLIGYGAGYNVTGNRNTIIGADDSLANLNLTSGSYNVAIGTNVGLPSATADGQLNIQNIIYGSGNTGTGSTVSSGKIGIGTTTPWAKLSVQATGGQINPVFEVASSSNATAFLSVAGSGFGTTTLSGLNISGSATSTSNVGFNITSGCFAISGTCLGGGSSLTGTTGQVAYFSGTNTAVGTSSMLIATSGNVGFGTTTPRAKIGMDGAFNDPATLTIAGIDQIYSFGMSGGGTSFGNSTYITNNPQTNPNTLVGSIIRVADNTALANTVRGLEVQANRGTNTQGENTGISAFGRTFGIRGTTDANAGGVYLPAGVFAETRGTVQGNALRAYSATITSADALVSLSHDTSAFASTGLLMNFANGSGTFTGDFMDLQVNGTSKFSVSSTGDMFVNGNAGFSTTTPRAKIGMDGTYNSPATLTIGGIDQILSFGMSGGGTSFGNSTYITNNPQTNPNTLVGSIIRVSDSTALANTVRGLEVQANRGTNTLGENTGISAFGRTFGIRGTTDADAGGTFLPAGVFAETRGTTQGNAVRAYSASITSANALVSLSHDTSTFTSTGLLMNFANGSGTFTGNFMDLQVNGTSKFSVSSAGNTFVNGTLGVGTSTPWRTLSVTGTVGFDGLTLNTGAATASLCLSATNEVTRNTDNESCITSSARYKNTIETLGAGFSLDEIMQLRSVSFQYNNATGTRYGFIAEEVFAIDPLLVGFDDEGLPNSVRYTSMIPLLTQAVQELNIKVDERTGFLVQDVAPYSATTTSTILTTATTSAATSTPWAGSFATSSATMIAKLGEYASRVIHYIGDSVYAAVGIFEKVFAKEVQTDKICVEDQCLTKDDVRALLELTRAQAAGAAASGGGGGGGGGGGSEPEEVQGDTSGETPANEGEGGAEVPPETEGDSGGDLGDEPQADPPVSPPPSDPPAVTQES